MSTKDDSTDDKRREALTIPETTERIVTLDFGNSCEVNREDFVEAHGTSESPRTVSDVKEGLCGSP